MDAVFGMIHWTVEEDELLINIYFHPLRPKLKINKVLETVGHYKYIIYI